MKSQALAALAAVLMLAGCGKPAPDQADAYAPPPDAAPVSKVLTEAELAALPPVEPPAPGTPGGLPDDRTPVSEAPFTPDSAQGAAQVVQTYFALIGEGKYGEAWSLWSDGGKASGMSQDEFAASFAKYYAYHAQIGAPGRIEGAAGSLYVEVPAVVYGRLKTGEAVHMAGPVTLRRVNDVPGSTAEQRRWHIASSGLKPRP